MGLYIEDNQARELAHELAQRRGCSVAEAVRAALQDARARLDDEAAAREVEVDRLLKTFRDCLAGQRFDHADLYDDKGEPVL